jgi:CheY-like chemotaxis protein
MVDRRDGRQPLVILSVDDESGVLALVRRCLDDGRVTLIEAGDGRTALEHITRVSTVDLLITDMRMPLTEGDALAREARALLPDLKVLYLTSPVDRQLRDGTPLRAGEACLDKPFTREGLREAVAMLLFGNTTLDVTINQTADKVRHEFKNQLAIIRGFAEILLAEPDVPAARRLDLNEIHKAAAVSLELIERLFPDSPGS